LRNLLFLSDITRKTALLKKKVLQINPHFHLYHIHILFGLHFNKVNFLFWPRLSYRSGGSSVIEPTLKISSNSMNKIFLLDFCHFRLKTSCREEVIHRQTEKEFVRIKNWSKIYSRKMFKVVLFVIRIVQKVNFFFIYLALGNV
jgi:hypothetical protein